MEQKSLLSLDPKATEKLEGTLERVVFHNEENGYTVFRVKTRKGDSVAVVGHMAAPQPGVAVRMTGRYVENAKWGRQFQMESYETMLPATTEGIRNYLASGLIKGVRGRMAQRIVEKFGEDTLRVLDEEPQKLASVQGISARTAETIRKCWVEHKCIRDLIMFLQPHGVSTSYAVRIFKHYGARSLEVVRENPYRLAMDIHGIGFLTADAVAQKLGFSHESDLRAEAAVLYMLRQLSDDGHVFYPMDSLITLVGDRLDIPPDNAERALKTLEAEERVVLEVLDGREAVYLSRYHHYESSISSYLVRILRSPKSVRFTDAERIADEVIGKLGISLAEEQELAIRTSTKEKVMVLTGGPGTGKTTIINAIIKVFAAANAKILLAAPTGRAAKRMTETSGREAKTIHRLLEYSPREDGFARNEDTPLACGLLIVDEASMMDTMLMYHLLKAVPLGATVIFVGDVNQLPSVGPGNVLNDVIRSGVVPVVTLTEIFRQAGESEIVCNAHMINRGEVPYLESSKDRLSDFYFIRQEDPERVADMIVDLVRSHIPRRFGLHPVDDIQVLTPMHKGTVGAANLNVRLQQALNGHTVMIKRGDRQFCLDDKVMQTRNNYEKDVFNGDIGRICRVDDEEREITVCFDDRNVVYAYEELDEIIPAYAISVHKSQGSEYPAVVMPVVTQHYVLLQRNLLYTGITRGKKLVVLVGTDKALHMAVANNKMRKRFTWLAQRLAGGLGAVMPENDVEAAEPQDERIGEND